MPDQMVESTVDSIPNDLCLREFENLAPTLRRIPKKQFTNRLQRVTVSLTDMDVNDDFLALGTNIGELVVYEWATDAMHKFTTRRYAPATCVRMERTIALYVAVAYSVCAVDVFYLPLDEKKVILEKVEIFPLTVHSAPITALCWSPNCFYLFSGDATGNLFYSTLEKVNLETYALEAEPSGIVELAYRYRRLLVATEGGVATRSGPVFGLRTVVGQKPRKRPMRLGADYLPSLCKEELSRFVACCPKNRLWLANSVTGQVERTFLLQPTHLQSRDKDIPLLPDAISTREPTISENDVQLTRVTALDETHSVMWSEQGLAVLNVATNGSSTLAASSFRFGKILRVRCTCSMVMKGRVEVFVLREALEGTSQLLRLATFPLIESKLLLGRKVSLPGLVSGAGREHTASVSSAMEQSTASGESRVLTSADAKRRLSEAAQSETNEAQLNPQQREFLNRWDTVLSKDLKGFFNGVAAAITNAATSTKSDEVEGIETGVEAATEMKKLPSPTTEKEPPVPAPTTVGPDSWQWFRGRLQHLQDTAATVHLPPAPWKLLAGDETQPLTMPPSHGEGGPNTSGAGQASTADNWAVLVAEEVPDVELAPQMSSLNAQDVDLDGEEEAAEVHLSLSPHRQTGTSGSKTMNLQPAKEVQLDSFSPPQPAFQLAPPNKMADFLEPALLDGRSSVELEEHIPQPTMTEESAVPRSDSLNSIGGDSVSRNVGCTDTMSADIMESEIFEQDNPMPTDLMVERKDSCEMWKNEMGSVSVPQSISSLKETQLENLLSSCSSRSTLSTEYAPAEVHPLSQSIISNVLNEEPPSSSNVTNVVPGLIIPPATPNSPAQPMKMHVSSEILAQCDRYLFHYLAFQCQWLCVCRSAIYAVDHRGKMFGCSLRQTRDQLSHNRVADMLLDLKWTTASTDVVLADKVHVSPCGSIAWRQHRGTVWVYEGTVTSHTMIHDSSTITSTATTSNRKSKRATMFATANNAMAKLRFRRGTDSGGLGAVSSGSTREVWSEVLQGIRCIDVDSHMSLYVTQSRGELRVQTGLHNGLPYHRSFYLQPPCTNVLDASCLDGIVWALGQSGTKKDLHVSLWATYLRQWKLAVDPPYIQWQSVHIPAALLNTVEQVFVGYQGTAWILTTDSKCYFTTEVSPGLPQGSGLWFQISLQRFLDMGLSEGTEHKFAGFSASAPGQTLQVCVKCRPALGKQWLGALWLSSECRRMLAVCQGPVLGHSWTCLQPRGLTAHNSRWRCLTNTFVDGRVYLWCCQASTGEVFSLWGEGQHRSQPLPSSTGDVIALAGSEKALWALTMKGSASSTTGSVPSTPTSSAFSGTSSGWAVHLLRGISPALPQGQRWITLRDLPSSLPLISLAASGDRLWAVDRDGEVFTCDVASVHLMDARQPSVRRAATSSVRPTWSSLETELKIRRPPERIRAVSGCVNWNGQPGLTLLWAVDIKGGVWAMKHNDSSEHPVWTSVPVPAAAESLHVTTGNVWLLTADTYQIFVRCRVSLPDHPEGESWLHIPSPAMGTEPETGNDPCQGVTELTVAPNNEAWVISEVPRRALLRHQTYLLNMSNVSGMSSTPSEEDDSMSAEEGKKLAADSKSSSRRSSKGKPQVNRQKSETEVEGDWEFLD